MKRFLLLRDNQEKGPYSLEELKTIGLKPSDLLWIEGQSIAWDYPMNLEEVKGCLGVINHPQAAPDQTSLPRLENSGFPYALSSPSEGPVPDAGLPNTAESFHSFSNEEPDQKHIIPESSKEPRVKVRKQAYHGFFASYGIWMTALFLLLVASVWVMKTAVDVFNGKGLAKSKMTPVSAPLKILPEGYTPTKAEDADIQNAISREIVPVDTLQVKEPVARKSKMKELKKYLQVESNDYKVGVFGGINNLELTVINNSAYILDKVVLQVDYLKPKGESVLTEKYTYFSIPPHGKKTLDIPPSKRGVKVKYKILDAKSREYKIDLVQA